MYCCLVHASSTKSASSVLVIVGKTGNLAETNFTKRAGKGGVMNWTSAHIQCQLLQHDSGNNHLEHQLWKFIADSFLFMGVGTIASHSFYSHICVCMQINCNSVASMKKKWICESVNR